MAQAAARPVDVEKAVHMLRSACQSQGGGTASSHAEDIATLLPSAAFLASHCTPALLSCIVDACDATSPVVGGTKRLAMLNAAWKLLLAVASYQDVAPRDYETAVVHMMEQLRWGVLTHDWSDKKRVRLATFFASHLVLAVRAHPQLLLTGTEAAHVFFAHLVRLYYAVCVTVATSTRDDEAVTTLYDNIVERLHGIFDCLGSAAAAMTMMTENRKAEWTATNSGQGTEKEVGGEGVEIVSNAVEALLTQCVSASAAFEVQEAAGGGEEVQQAAATAGLSTYLHVMQGVLKRLPGSSGTPEAEAAASSGPTEETAGDEGKRAGKADKAAAERSVGSSAVGRDTLHLLTESLLCWTGQRATHRDGNGSVGDGSACERQHSCSNAGATVKQDIQTLSEKLPTALFAYSPPNGGSDTKRDVSPFSSTAASTSLRAMWVSALAALWQQWIFLCANAEEAEGNNDSSTSDDGGTSSRCRIGPTAWAMSGGTDVQPSVSNAASLSAHLSTVVLSSITCVPHASTMALMALEAWTELFHRLERAAKPTSSPSQPMQRTAVRVLLRVLGNIRYAATDLVQGLLHLQKREDVTHAPDAVLDGGCASTSALLEQWICAAVALLSYGESALCIETTNPPANDDDDEVRGAAEQRHAAVVLLSLLIEVMRTKTTLSCAAAQKGEDYAPPAVAVAELREALVSLQQETRKTWKQNTPPADHSYLLCQLLIQIPRKLHNVVGAFTAMSVLSCSLPDNEEGLSKPPGQLKLSLLSCSSLLASLTQTLQRLSENSTGGEEEEEEESASARVARWVAARLLHEMAAVPVSDSADDAVLVACVRRWTDVAFSATSPSPVPPRKDSAARRCGDAVVYADAAASLLRLAQECTSLDLETLNLSDAAVAALVELVEGDSQASDNADAVARWGVLQDEETRQWSASTAWLRKQRDMAETASGENTDVVFPNTSDDRDEGVSSMSLRSSPTVADYLRGLRYCTAVLQQLHDDVTTNAVTAEDGAHSNKRRRVDDGGEDGSSEERRTVDISEREHASITCTLARIRELSRSTLAQLEGGTGAATPTPSLPSLSVPISKNVKDELRAGRSEEVLQKDAQVFTLSDTESMASRRRPSSTEVIDIE
ncbi:hypothetical protein ABB37_02271 [Leptomonas pyrrhocoris]|uniref:Uncharacterized protein n=1 Tax=Leptomonas pyrrhocoris TaxID=157538 RepID=A0A0M9G7V5_LEPPY|nr:hypothetical protein ABB37_02271 [Leptomonas pyrrhocoris]KPA84219.1 hypothetical protein ABB37_02271 [Leptomonas pyrrhocoris]|eukprot:XP_015662658.1 hypothetical protein ABB37_02271 [Leptomonas pyrrhocoris]